MPASDDPNAENNLTLSQALLGMLYITAGVNHFISEKFYVDIVPDSLPNKREIVQISGVAEIIGGVGVLAPRTRRFAGKWLVALLIAIFPANINMALKPERYKRFPAWALWARLPIQFVAIAWAWAATHGEEDRPAASEAAADSELVVPEAAAELEPQPA